MNPPTRDHWKMPVTDIFPSEVTPFTIINLKRMIRRELKQKADFYSSCPLWQKEFLNRANSYSFSDATVDFWKYGNNQFSNIISKIEEEVMHFPCNDISK